MSYDKKLHLASGFAIAFVFGIANPWIGLGCGMAAGVAKEIYDYFVYGLFDKKDMLFTWLGATVGAGLTLLWRCCSGGDYC